MSFSSPVCPKTPQKSHVYAPDQQISPFPPLPSLYASMPRPSRHRSPLAASAEISGCPSERRRRQFKSLDSTQRTPSKSGKRTGSMEEPRTQLLRHNMKDLISKTRKELRRKRSFGPPSSSSDGFDVDMDDIEETDDQILDEEFYCRIINNTNSNIRRGYSRSYRQEVGSSLDPDLEDITKWERELSNYERSQFFAQNSASLDAPEPEPLPEFDPDMVVRDEQDELQMYAKEAAALDELSAMSERELMAFLEEVDADDID